jgi:hypothetical protein
VGQGSAILSSGQTGYLDHLFSSLFSSWLRSFYHRNRISTIPASRFETGNALPKIGVIKVYVVEYRHSKLILRFSSRGLFLKIDKVGTKLS